MAAELRVSEAIAQRFSGNQEIQLVRVRAASNAVGRYGSVQNWDAMAAELAVSAAIAQRFPSNPEIQLRRAGCLLAQTSSFYKFGLDKDAAEHELMTHLQQHAYLMEMQPFSQLNRAT